MEAFVAMPWAAVLAEMSSMVPLEQPARMATMGMLASMVVTALMGAMVLMVQMLAMVSMASWATMASTVRMSSMFAEVLSRTTARRIGN